MHPQVKTQTPPILYIRLLPLVWVGVALILFISPYLRGLFFPPDLLIAQITIAATFFLWLLDRIIRHEGAIRLDLQDWAVLAFAGAYLLSVPHAVSAPGAWGAFFKAVSYTLVYFMVSRLVTTRPALRSVMSLLFWSGTGVALVGILGSAGYLYYPGAFDGRAMMSTFQYTNALASFLTVVSLIGLPLQTRTRKIAWQVLYSLGQLAILIALFCSQSRGGWLVYGGALLVYCIGLPRPALYRTIYVTLACLIDAVLVTRSFLPAVSAHNGAQALKILLVGIAALAALQLVVFAIDHLYLKRAGHRTRQAVIIGAAVYCAVALTGYVLLAGEGSPSTAAYYLPSPILARVQSIGGTDPSFLARLAFDLDALSIIKDNLLFGTGGGGWEALYHSYQKSQYFTTEVHNHFLQVGVEAGLLGLAAFLACWYGMVKRLLAAKKQQKQWPYLWALGVGAAALGVHSFFDFQLSLPAIALLLWSLWALLRSRTEEDGERHHRRHRRHKGGLAQFESALSAIRRRVRPWAHHRVLQNIVFISLVLLLLSYSGASYKAGVLGAQAAAAAEQQKLVVARELYQRANRLDPLTGTYAADLAQVLTVMGLAQDSQEDLDRAREVVKQATLSEPYNPKIRAAASYVYLLQGCIDESVAEAEALVRINPWDLSAYEQLGRAYVGGAQYYQRFGYQQEAKDLLESALDLRTRVMKKSQTAAAPERWQGPELKVSPSLRLTCGQANYLLQRPAEALPDLEVAYKNKELAPEAAPWLAACQSKIGKASQASSILKQYPDTKKEFERLIASLT